MSKKFANCIILIHNALKAGMGQHCKTDTISDQEGNYSNIPNERGASNNIWH